MLKRSAGAQLYVRLCRYISNRPAKLLREKYDAERRDYPQQRVGNIIVYGRAPFVADVTRALAALADGYPYGYSLVQRYVHAVEEKGFVTSPSIEDWKHLAGFGARSEKPTPEGRLPVTSERYASFLVQFAAERRRILWSIPRSEKAAAWQKKKEQHAMSRLLRARGF
jgi:hypothetical protein